ncbi:glycosyltransferase family 4 protein [Alicyclobacillus fodiniaquatilis]|uniref:Glycosyltransferase family 4 protein n=1 Tax=Alicyclobacillus fodiniaquatilis TaxID=1661150 RepID=A0ABW4JMR4_9BACL
MNRGLRILVVSQTNLKHVGGLERVVNEQIEYLERKGFEVEVLSVDKTTNHLTALSRLRFRLNAAFVSLKSDIVIAHGSDGAFVAICGLITRVFGKSRRLVTFTHGIEQRLRQIEQKNQWGIRRYFAELQSCWSVRYSYMTVVMSNEDKDWLLGNYVASPEQLYLFRNSINNNYRSIEFKSRRKPSYSILFVGSPIYRKGFDLLLASFVKVKQFYPCARLTLAVGDKELDLSNIDGVEIVSLSSDEESINAYRSHDICILPSRFEGLPLSVLEAMSCGSLVITTNRCGMKDVITSWENGILTELDVEEIVRAILWSWEHWGEVDRIRKEAYNSVREWTWEESFSDLISHVIKS